MARIIVADRAHLISFEKGRPQKSQHFGLVVRLGNRPVEFMFDWNARGGFYAMEVVTNEEGRIVRAYPEAGYPLELPGIIGREGAPDASLVIVNANDPSMAITQNTLDQFNILITEGIITEIGGQA